MVYSAWSEQLFPPLMTENKKAMLFFCNASHIYYRDALQCKRHHSSLLYWNAAFQASFFLRYYSWLNGCTLYSEHLLIPYSFTQSLQVTGPHLQAIPWSLTQDISTELSEMDGRGNVASAATVQYRFLRFICVGEILSLQ